MAEGGISSDGKTEIANGLAVLPEVICSDTSTDLDISVPMKVGTENPTCRTADYCYKNNNKHFYVANL